MDALITYSGYFLTLLASLIAFLQFKAKAKAERELQEAKHAHDDQSSVTERKFAVYKEYLAKLDSIHRDVHASLTTEDNRTRIHTVLERLATNPSDVSHYAQFMKLMADVLMDWIKQQNRVLDELNGLRLVCSERIEQLLDEYVTSVQDYLQTTLQMSAFVVGSRPGSVNTELFAQYRTHHEDTHRLLKEIQKEMRRDIGM